MEQIKKKRTRKLDLLLVLVLLVLARICCPALSNIPLFNMTFTFIYGVAFIFLYLLSAKKIKIKDFSLVLAAVVYTAYVLLRGFFADKGLFAREPFNAYIIVFLTMIYIWVKGQPLKIKAFLFKFILATLIFDYVYSIIVLFFDPNASRLAAATNLLQGSPYDILNAVGSFDAVYGGLFVIVILICMRQSLKKKKVKNKLSLLVLLLALAFILMSAYGTALVLLTVALALLLARKSKAFSLILLLIIAGVLIFHEPIGQWIIDLSKGITYSDMISTRVKDIGYMLKTFESAGTYAGETGRTARMMWSWETFEKYPIFGGMGMLDAKIGGHSELFDLLGNFGLIGFACVTAYFIALYKSIRLSLPSKEMKTCWNIIMLVFIVSSILNPSLYSLQMMPMILMIALAPSYAEICRNKKS